MRETGAYGRQLGKALQVSRAASFVTRGTLNQADIAVTHIRADVADNAMTAPVSTEDAFLVMLQLRDWPKRILWADDKLVNTSPLHAGAISIFDLRRKWVGHRVCPIEQLNFYLPRRTIDALCDMEDLPRLDEFEQDPRGGLNDATIYSLGRALLPAFQRRHETNRLFVDSITAAIAVHVVKTYGRRTSPGEDRLSESIGRAKDMLAANLSGNISITELAIACGLPVSRFGRAFARSTGLSPQRWLMQRRMEEAMRLLRMSDLAPEDVAVASGFVNLRHMNRLFLSSLGVSSRTWRMAARN
jgi:AraC family transcriptional regulator